MILAVGSIFFWLLIVLAAVCVVVAALAVCDCLRKGSHEWDEFQAWLRARDVTGRSR